MKKRNLLVGALFALLSVPAPAEGMYVYGGLGGAGYSEAQNDFNDALYSAAPASGTSDETAGAIKLGIGHRFNENWGIEGGLFGTGKFRRTVYSAAGTQTRDLSASAIYVAGTFFIPVGRDRDSDFHFRAGLASWKLDRDYRTNGMPTASFEESGGSLTLGLGFAATFAPNAAIFVDYDVFATRMRSGGPDADENATFGLLTVGIRGNF